METESTKMEELKQNKNYAELILFARILLLAPDCLKRCVSNHTLAQIPLGCVYLYTHSHVHMNVCANVSVCIPPSAFSSVFSPQGFQSHVHKPHSIRSSQHKLKHKEHYHSADATLRNVYFNVEEVELNTMTLKQSCQVALFINKTQKTKLYIG